MNNNSVNKHSLLTITFCLLIQFNIFAETTLPQENPVPGGLAIIDLVSVDETKPLVKFFSKRVLVRKNNDYWQAIVGLPLKIKPGLHKINIIHNGKKSSKSFTVQNKDYETRHITIKNKRMVSPNKKDIDRHYKEKPLITAALKTWSENDDVQTEFSYPVKGRFSSPFGLKRIYNKQARIRRHTGLDIAAPIGTEIFAPAQGKVILTGNYFFTGNSVFLDHGQGLITMYIHMDKIDVKVGQQLQKHEKIGTVGMTGRVSGPHLHWVVSLNNTKVDPNLFVEHAAE